MSSSTPTPQQLLFAAWATLRPWSDLQLEGNSGRGVAASLSSPIWLDTVTRVLDFDRLGLSIEQLREEIELARKQCAQRSGTHFSNCTFTNEGAVTISADDLLEAVRI